MIFWAPLPREILCVVFRWAPPLYEPMSVRVSVLKIVRFSVHSFLMRFSVSPFLVRFSVPPLCVSLSPTGYWDTGTLGDWDTRTLGHRDTGTPRYQDIGTLGQCDTGTLGHRDTGTMGHQNTGTPRHWDIGTLGHLDTGTPEQWAGWRRSGNIAQLSCGLSLATTNLSYLTSCCSNHLTRIMNGHMVPPLYNMALLLNGNGESEYGETLFLDQWKKQS